MDLARGRSSPTDRLQSTQAGRRPVVLPTAEAVVQVQPVPTGSRPIWFFRRSSLRLRSGVSRDGGVDGPGRMADFEIGDSMVF